MSTRCETCGRGFCQGNDPCPDTQHSPACEDDMCAECVLVATVKQQCAELTSAWAQLGDAIAEIRRLHAGPEVDHVVAVDEMAPQEPCCSDGGCCTHAGGR